MVVMSFPSHSMVRILQEGTALESMMTVQTPQAPPPQEILVPVNPRVSRSVKTSVWEGSIWPARFPHRAHGSLH